MSLILTKRIFLLGFKSIWRHKLRSMLTILGIVFGVGSVISMLAIGEGASYETQERIKRLGSLNIIIYSKKPDESDKASTQKDRMSEYGLKYADARRIRNTFPSVEVMVTQRNISADFLYRRKKVDGDIIATVPWFPDVRNRKILNGRFFSDAESMDKKSVCVITKDLAKKMFLFEDPIGKTLKMRGECFAVVGVIDQPGSENSGEMQNEKSLANGNLEAYIPITTAKERYGEIITNFQSGTYAIEKIELHQIILKVNDVNLVMPTYELAEKLLARHHKEKDYDFIVPRKLLEEAEQTKKMFNIVLGSIAAISLLVGGIGIMNIMLATVTERTKEIGIRRALGAKKHDIIMQFVTETILLSGIGGLMGLLFGMCVPLLVSHFAEMKTIIKLWSLFMSFGISIMVGLAFGIYPAYRAANMDPITALRHE